MESSTFDGYINGGIQGAAILTVSVMPATTKAIRIREVNWNAIKNGNYGSAYVTNFDIPITNASTLAYTLPNIENDNANAEIAWEGQTIGSDGSLSANATIGGTFSIDFFYATNWLVAPFYDGRAQLKQNLIFQLRAAGLYSSFLFYIQMALVLRA